MDNKKKRKLTKCKIKYCIKSIAIFLQFKKLNFINHILIFIHYSFFHFHELFHEFQGTNMNII